MATKHLNKIFLSASIPAIHRDEKFYRTADVVAIRDSVRALAVSVVPKTHLVWGGHPSITPLIRNVVIRMTTNIQQHVTLYQSLFYEKYFPKDNFDFENIVAVPADPEGKIASLAAMRTRMISENNFVAAIFVGGMEGIFDEYEMFKQYHPNALILPVASTGGAAKFLYENNPSSYDERLATDYAYMSLFKDILRDYMI